MAKIKLNPEAAHAIVGSLRSSALTFDVPDCNCFANHDSQSKMMSEFEKRVNDVQKLIERYQELLESDAAALESACNAIILSDHVLAAMHDVIGHGRENGIGNASNYHNDENRHSAGGEF